MSTTDNVHPSALARCTGFPSLTKRGEGRFAPVRPAALKGGDGTGHNPVAVVRGFDRPASTFPHHMQVDIQGAPAWKEELNG